MIAKLKFTKPDGADIEDIASFIDDALSSYGGALHPDDPMFHSLRGKMEYIIVNGQKFIPRALGNAQ